MATNAFECHNHRLCRSSGLEDARRHCAENGLRLTAVREHVLEILLESHRALGAYDILGRLKRDGFGDQPPVVYRALDFLVAHGFVHRLERLNAFAACCHGGEGHSPMFLICHDCQAVAEAPLGAIAGRIDATAASVGFAVDDRVVEVIGQCPSCRGAA